MRVLLLVSLKTGGGYVQASLSLMEGQVKLVSFVLRCWFSRWNRICLNYYWVSISNRIYR
jgi:hypothetical protein